MMGDNVGPNHRLHQNKKQLTSTPVRACATANLTFYTVLSRKQIINDTIPRASVRTLKASDKGERNDDVWF